MHKYVRVLQVRRRTDVQGKRLVSTAQHSSQHHVQGCMRKAGTVTCQRGWCWAQRCLQRTSQVVPAWRAGLQRP